MKTGIPTQYNGTNFRSRLEAKWARMFDLLGWNWEYEPFDMDGYIPDFILQVPRHLSNKIDTYIVEIKPATDFHELREMASKSQNEALDSVIQTGKRALRLGAILSLNGNLGCIGVGDAAIDEQGFHGEPVGIMIRNGGYTLVPYGGFRCDDFVESCFPKVRELWAEARNTTQYDRVFLANHKRISNRLVHKSPLPPCPSGQPLKIEDFFSEENLRLAREMFENRKV